MDRVLASRPAALGSILIIPEFFWTHLSTAQTVQSLVVNQTHLLLVSGQLVLQKKLDKLFDPGGCSTRGRRAPEEPDEHQRLRDSGHQHSQQAQKRLDQLY